LDKLFNVIEEKVFELLKIKDERIANIYYGAIAVLRTNSDKETSVEEKKEAELRPTLTYNPERLFQAAHSIRETLNLLLRRIDIPEQVDKNKARIRKFADPMANLPDYLYASHDNLFRLHNWFVAVSHHEKDTDEEEFNEKLDMYNSIMLQILSPHFESEEKIDEILKIENPDLEDLKKLLESMTNTQLYNYVFLKANSQWLSLFQRGPFFKEPPLPRRFDDAIQYPTWPESQYLSKIAQENPKEVFDIISKCHVPESKNDWNPRVFEDFVRVGIKMPCEFATKLAEKIVKERWEDPIQFSLLNDEISNLMEKISDECNDTELAAKLAELILDVDLVEVEVGEKNEN